MAKANHFRFSTKYQDDETDLLYYGYRYYNASTGRWLSRDYREESGGPNLFGFGPNAPTLGADSLGAKWYNPYSWIYDPSTSVTYPPADLIDPKKMQLNVGKCQIVVLFGHGNPTDAWTWKVANCAAGTAIMCWPDANAEGIGEGHDIWPWEQIPEKENIPVFWGSYSPSPNDEYKKTGGNYLADKIFDLVYGQTKTKAVDICGKQCCGEIRVRFIWVAKGRKLVFNPTNRQTQYEGKTTIQDYVLNCKTKATRLVPR